ncbi:MAG: hypothetical protein [Caudoviricetes sp.]|nr:MAG: hypothetical protein [Caudoviricetes sp.]
MAARIKKLHRHRTEKQKLADALINSSNSWVGINDYRFKPARTITRNIKKARRQSDLNYK